MFKFPKLQLPLDDSEAPPPPPDPTVPTLTGLRLTKRQRALFPREGGGGHSQPGRKGFSMEAEAAAGGAHRIETNESGVSVLTVNVGGREVRWIVWAGAGGGSGGGGGYAIFSGNRSFEAR